MASINYPFLTPIFHKLVMPFSPNVNAKSGQYGTINQNILLHFFISSAVVKITSYSSKTSGRPCLLVTTAALQRIAHPRKIKPSPLPRVLRRTSRRCRSSGGGFFLACGTLLFPRSDRFHLWFLNRRLRYPAIAEDRGRGSAVEIVLLDSRRRSQRPRHGWRWGYAAPPRARGEVR